MCNTAEGDGPTGHGGDEFQRGSFVFDSSDFINDGDTDFIFVETFFGQFSETRAEAPRRFPRGAERSEEGAGRHRRQDGR